MEPTRRHRTTASLSESAKIAACWVCAVAIFSALMGVCWAADITPGYTFSSGEKNITHTKLNDAAAGTVNAAFITGKTASTPAGADSMVFYSSGELALRKATLSTLFANAPAINGLSTINSVGNFSVATSKFTVAAADGATAVAGKLTLSSNAVVSVTHAGPAVLITNLSSSASATALTLYGGFGSAPALSVASGGMSVTGVSSINGNLTLGSGYTTTAAGQLVASNTAAFYGNTTLGDASGDTVTVNGTLAGTLQGTPTVSLTSVSADTAADAVLLKDASDSSKLKTALLSSLLPKTFTATAALSVGKPIDTAHNLGGVPDSVSFFLVCTNAEHGYSVGDYVALHQFTDSIYAGLRTGGGANATNVFAILATTTPSTWVKTNTASFSAITAINWNIVVKATRNQ